MATLNYEIIDHGVDGEQYFPGCGVSFTRYTDVITGIGDSAREAGADAFAMMKTPDGVDDSALRADLAKLPEDYDAHDMCDVPDRDTTTGTNDHDETCEMHHYVSIRWSITP